MIYFPSFFFVRYSAKKAVELGFDWTRTVRRFLVLLDGIAINMSTGCDCVWGARYFAGLY